MVSCIAHGGGGRSGVAGAESGDGRLVDESGRERGGGDGAVCGSWDVGAVSPWVQDGSGRGACAVGEVCDECAGVGDEHVGLQPVEVDGSGWTDGAWMAEAWQGQASSAAHGDAGVDVFCELVGARGAVYEVGFRRGTSSDMGVRGRVLEAGPWTGEVLESPGSFGPFLAGRYFRVFRQRMVFDRGEDVR